MKTICEAIIRCDYKFEGADGLADNRERMGLKGSNLRDPEEQRVPGIALLGGRRRTIRVPP
jgi:hypothetical protein